MTEKMLVEALRWYADPIAYSMPVQDMEHHVFPDRGHRAREALAAALPDDALREPVVYQCPRCATSMEIDHSAKPKGLFDQSERERGLVEACHAAIAYDAAIYSCANDPEKMSSFCSAQGDDLDSLYINWINKAREALAAYESAAPQEVATTAPHKSREDISAPAAAADSLTAAEIELNAEGQGKQGNPDQAIRSLPVAAPAPSAPVYKCESCGEEFCEPMPSGHAVPRMDNEGRPYPEQCGPVSRFHASAPEKMAQQLERDNAALREQLAAAQKDAVRYRWLNDQHNFLIYIEDQEQMRTNLRVRCGQPLNDWIDAALPRQGKKHDKA